MKTADSRASVSACFDESGRGAGQADRTTTSVRGKLSMKKLEYQVSFTTPAFLGNDPGR
jgi:hypothetical protein